MAGGTTFFDLPPEIRNRIYEYSTNHVECTVCGERMYAHSTSDHCRKAREAKRVPWISKGHHSSYAKECTFQPSYLSIVYDSGLRPPPITQVNKLTRAETLPMWYGQNTFHLGFVFDHNKEPKLGLSIKSWLSAIGVKAAGMLHEISLELVGSARSDGKFGTSALNSLHELGIDFVKVRFRDVQEGNASKLETQRKRLYG